MRKRVPLDPRDGKNLTNITKSLLAKWNPLKAKGKGRNKATTLYVNRPTHVVDTGLCGKYCRVKVER